jgi:hypothetical protein
MALMLLDKTNIKNNLIKKKNELESTKQTRGESNAYHQIQ